MQACWRGSLPRLSGAKMRIVAGSYSEVGVPELLGDESKRGAAPGKRTQRVCVTENMETDRRVEAGAA